MMRAKTFTDPLNHSVYPTPHPTYTCTKFRRVAFQTLEPRGVFQGCEVEED